MRDDINTISQWCESGVRVVSVTQKIDLIRRGWASWSRFFGGIDEIELQYFKAKQVVGIAVAKEKGVYKGRKKGMTKAELERARALKAKGLKEKEFATALGVTERTVFRYLGKL